MFKGHNSVKQELQASHNAYLSSFFYLQIKTTIMMKRQTWWPQYPDTFVFKRKRANKIISLPTVLLSCYVCLFEVNLHRKLETQNCFKDFITGRSFDSEWKISHYNNILQLWLILGFVDFHFCILLRKVETERCKILAIKSALAQSWLSRSGYFESFPSFSTSF